MRSLESAGTAGLLVILAVMGIIISQSIHTGMPAIHTGEMPLWSVKVKHLPALSSQGPLEHPESVLPSSSGVKSFVSQHHDSLMERRRPVWQVSCR